MAEKRTEVKTYTVSYICDECNLGEMIPTGEVIDVNPVLYVHRCNKCNSTLTFESCYPITVYAVVKQPNLYVTHALE